MKVLSCLSLFFCLPVLAVDIVTENGAAACKTFTAHRELRVFKDPTLFLPEISRILADPKSGWDRVRNESPLINTFKGEVSLAQLGKPREFKNFGVIARLYESADSRLKLVDPETGERSPVRIIPVQICGQDTLGFVLEEDLKRAPVDEEAEMNGTMAPSVKTH